MEIRNRRSSRVPAKEEPGAVEFHWVDIYPLIGLVGLAGYLILG